MSAPGVVDRRGIAGAAALVAVGNVASRALGLVREAFIANRFGADGSVSAFRVANRTYNLLYELLIGGVMASALVPVLSEYAEKDRLEYRRLLTSLSFVLLVIVGLALVALEVAAPLAADAMGSGFGPELHALTVEMLRVVFPAVLLMSLAGLLSAALYSLKRFLFPSFSAAIFNIGLIAGAVILAEQHRAVALAYGVLVGAAAQLLLQLVGLWRAGIRPARCLLHPALKRILLLALPILGSLAVGQAQVVIDSNLASRTGEQSLAWMANATTLIQFPLGLVATAISVASLPQLARLALSDRDGHEFAATLAFGLRLVTLLILPATAALAAIGAPLIELMFEHGAFTPADSVAVTAALHLYLLGLPAAALDQCLLMAFYARGDTLRPALVGVAGVGIYLAVALATMNSMGMLGLVLANSCQWVGHLALMSWLAIRRLPALGAQPLIRPLAQALGASVGAFGAMALALQALGAATAWGLLGELVRVAAPAVAGALTYVLLLRLSGNGDLDSAWQAFRGRLRPGSRAV